MYRPIQITFAVLALFPLVAFADHGSGAVEISCDAANDTLTINTYIKWNEDYDTFIATHPSGAAVSKDAAVFTLKEIKDKVDYMCRLKMKAFTVRISRSALYVLTSEGKPIYKYYDTYPSGESIYGLSSPIEKYYLRIASDAKVVECVTRTREKEICKPFTVGE